MSLGVLPAWLVLRDAHPLYLNMIPCQMVSAPLIVSDPSTMTDSPGYGLIVIGNTDEPAIVLTKSPVYVPARKYTVLPGAIA